jgi:signal transduction histidine kinase
MNELLENLDDLIHDKKIEVVKHFLPDVSVFMNPYLAEMLIVNLVKNAVRHNIKGGKLVVEVGKGYLQVSNTGPKFPVDETLLFKRYLKSSSAPESLGLGLSIVQKICTLYGFEVSYRFAENLHCLKVDFKKEA